MKNPLRNGFGAVARGLRWAAQFSPLTWRGIVAAPLLGWAFFRYARAPIEKRDFVLSSLCSGALALLGLGIVATLAVAAWLKFRPQPRKGEPWRGEAGRPFRSGYSIGFVSWIPFVNIRISYDRPGGVKVELVREGARLVEEATPAERCWASEIVRRFTVSDIFGLARWSVRRREARELRLLPHCDAAPSPEILDRPGAGDAMSHPAGRPEGDLIEMRAYTQGDALKRILWKVYARTGRLLVRVSEKAVSPVPRTLAYLIAGEGDEATAGAARRMVESRQLGHDVLFSSDGEQTPVTEPVDALDQIVRSHEARDKGGVGLGSFLAEGEGRGYDACVLFAPARVGEWLERVEGQAHGRCALRAIIGVDDEPAPRRRGRLARFLLREPGEKEAAELREVRERLMASGIEVAVINRQTGASIQEDGPPGSSHE